MKRLANKVALVTGGAQGLGGATARRLAAEGATVLIADIDDAAADRRVASITAAGGVAATFHADVGIHQDVQAMVTYTLERWQRLDILVNNAYAVIDPGGYRQCIGGQCGRLGTGAWPCSPSPSSWRRNTPCR